MSAAETEDVATLKAQIQQQGEALEKLDEHVEELLKVEEQLTEEKKVR